jgi:CBS domain-containing protein
MAQIQTRFAKLVSALEEVVAAGDSARLQLGLLKLNARDSSEKVEFSVRAFEDKIEKGLEEILHVATRKTRDLAEVVRTMVGTKHNDATVGAIMTGPVRTCCFSDSLNRAAELMWEHDCGAVPVVDAEGRLSGIITDRDICMAAYTQGVALSAIRVGDTMSVPAHACRADDTVAKAATLMAEAEVRRLPVVDKEDYPIGIVSVADIARNAEVLGGRNAEPVAFQLLRAVTKRRRSQSPLSCAAE